jgi:AraC family transcriptional regulator of adaptative response/methylated-DNA-[protein]-cysteine methyltransferase
LELTPDKVRQLFKRTLGVTHKQYADAVRIERFKASLIAGESIAGATYDAGYGSSSRVYERAGKRLGMTPGAYKRAGKGERVEFVTWQCEFGAVLVASTAKGICSVKLGMCSQVLESALREEFGQAHIEQLAHATSPQVAAVRAYLDGCGPAPKSVPTDVVATAFQARVWSALRTIPAGETRSYSEVAAQIGSPRAVRAVASACARNPVALIVPCHRVLPKGADASEPGEYRWGRETKVRLLTLDGAGGNDDSEKYT